MICILCGTTPATQKIPRGNGKSDSICQMCADARAARASVESDYEKWGLNEDSIAFLSQLRIKEGRP